MDNKEFFNKCIVMTEYMMELEEVKLRIFRGLKANLKDEKIQRVIDWEGKRITECYDEEGYCVLCRSIMDKYSKQWNCYSSSGTHEIIMFVSDMIILIAEHSKDVQLQIKKSKIKSLREEIKKLEGEELNNQLERGQE